MGKAATKLAVSGGRSRTISSIAIDLRSIICAGPVRNGMRSKISKYPPGHCLHLRDCGGSTWDAGTDAPPHDHALLAEENAAADLLADLLLRLIFSLICASSKAANLLKPTSLSMSSSQIRIAFGSVVATIPLSGSRACAAFSVGRTFGSADPRNYDLGNFPRLRKRLHQAARIHAEFTLASVASGASACNSISRVDHLHMMQS